MNMISRKTPLRRRRKARVERPLRVGILTLPLHINYGGIIQAAALYRMIEDMGHHPVFLDKKPKRSLPHRLSKRLLASIPGQNIGNVREAVRNMNVHKPFVRRFLPDVTRPLMTGNDLAAAVRRRRLDAVVVGSDQVWRPHYHQDEQALVYFLDFVEPEVTARIAYAASFGKPQWEHADIAEPASELLSDFAHVSVRENTAADICAEAFGVENAEVVLDPTLAVDPRFYEEVASDAADLDCEDGEFVFEYVLDRERIEPGIAERLADDLPDLSHARAIHPELPGDADTLPDWMAHFRHAGCVLTDSFHGTVFCILNRRNFITIVNPKRGADRFHTLLGALGLEGRIVKRLDDATARRLLSQPIDYDAVHDKLDALRRSSRDFLQGALDAAR